MPTWAKMIPENLKNHTIPYSAAHTYIAHKMGVPPPPRGDTSICWIFNNYSPKWRWLAVDIYRAAKRRGKYLTRATDTEVNSCFSIY